MRKLISEENSQSPPDPILDKFKNIVKMLEVNTESTSWHYDLIETHTEWQDLKKNKSIKRVFSFHNAAQTNEQFAIRTKLEEIENLVRQDSSRKANLLLWDDRYTLYKPHPNTCIEDDVSDEREKRMVDWLLTSSGDDFTAIGIYGMGGSGKTALVKNVLKQKTVGNKFKCIIWACLSQLTCKEEIDDWIVNYLLYRLGSDTDSLVGDMDEKKDLLMEELERRLLKSGNYILVFDDIWHCSEWFAVNFLGKLKKVGGSAVIVTSRRKTVAEKIVDKNRLIHLNPRDYKESAFLKDVAKDLGE